MNSPLWPNPFTDDRLTDTDGYDPALDVETVHQAASAYLEKEIERIPKLRQPDGNTKVAVLLATPGFGKTHVIGRVQHRLRDKALFVFVPQIEEHGAPIPHITWHLLKRLFDAPSGQRPLLHDLLARLCQHSFRRYFEALPHTVKEKHKTLRERLEGPSEAVLEIVRESKEPAPFLALADSIAARYPALHREILRALLLGWSPCKDEAWRWLRGDQVDEARLNELQLSSTPPTLHALLETLTGLLHPLHMPVVLCCDQSEKLLQRPGAMSKLTTALMGWVDGIPNLILTMTFLNDDWKKLDESFAGFRGRCRLLTLDTLKGPQAVELVRKRMVGWPGARTEKGPIWPFREADIAKLAEKPLQARGLLKTCSLGLDAWLVKKSQNGIVIGTDSSSPPREDLFRREWDQVLSAVRKEQIVPDNLQEERLFRSLREALALFQEGKCSLAGLELLQMQEGAVKKHLSLQLKLAQKGSNTSFPVVLAVTKLSGGMPMTKFFEALKTSIDAPVEGAVLVRPSAQMTLGPKTVGRQTYETLKSRSKLRPYELSEHRTAFEQMECYLRLLDLAEQKNLLLGQQTISAKEVRQLTIATSMLQGLDLYEKVFSGWVQTSAPVAVCPVARVAVAQPALAAAQGGAVSTVAVKSAPPRDAEPKPAALQGEGWADQVLHAVKTKLIEFGQNVEPLGVQIGPTFVRLKLRPLGRTSIGKVRNYANDLRTHIAAITQVPVISDQPGYISIDVKRPDRQTVSLGACLKPVPAGMHQQPAFPVGVDVTGQPHWLNLAEPSTCHILAAGTTGSGKSEFLKAMLAGLAAQLSPLELQLILIDPKRVTFNFSGPSPYLKHPVAHTIEEAMLRVEECVTETERRYALLEQKRLEHVGQLSGRDALPRIVIVFDEFADLMADLEHRKALENSLKRIGALARAAGIHLVLATQRPDKDVVTPLLKANLPTRICLRVDSARNSNIILDEEGGENLLGHGDLFWKHGGGMMRLQGALVVRTELEKRLRIES